MTGSCIIDGVDISTLGMFIERGGSDDFLSFPNRREPDQVDWPDEDGLDVDLTDCYFDAKTVKVNYVIIAEDEVTFKNNLNTFETLHFVPGYRQIYVKEFNKTFSLRFVGFSDYKHSGGLYKRAKKIGKITAEYSMDDPLQIFTDAINTPISTREYLSHISINGYDLSRFGIVVQDVYSTALRPHSAKSVMERKISNLNGAIADVGVTPKTQPRTIEIQCTMLAGSYSEFMTNYTALFNNLRISQPVKLNIRTNKSIYCYYNKMNSFRKLSVFAERIKVSFSIEFIEIQLVELYRLLATQLGQFIITESGEFIDLNY
jgi:hypothetical protein